MTCTGGGVRGHIRTKLLGPFVSVLLLLCFALSGGTALPATNERMFDMKVVVSSCRTLTLEIGEQYLVLAH